MKRINDESLYMCCPSKCTKSLRDFSPSGFSLCARECALCLLSSSDTDLYLLHPVQMLIIRQRLTALCAS